MLKHVVSQNWLFEHGNAENIVIADCRFALGNPASGRDAYAADHIPGAVYFDLEEDLSAPKSEHGGRHPLPDWNALARKLGSAGIGSDTTVIAYDDQGGAMASRFWWLLQFLGHKQVYVLDGTYAHWKEAGYPVTDEPPIVHEAVFVPEPQESMLVSMEDVKNRLGQPGTVILDSRESRRYLGLEEAIDPVAGHIPGARNDFWKNSLNEWGNWRSGDDQKRRFADLQTADEIIVYCGSGVTACPNVMALQEAGFSNVKLYAGSWSDWVSYKDNPVATGEE
ncbi:sulfurtransferase [Paenibacillus rigui]|uniref:Sulfurtransferase n=1 Tax=Paenibacillus rigui TaxID=554312 RepID=A0A229UIK4_9BACL|nr:sulfurtransferase [Paenibacillus rigui]OXM83203.1 sulfurtransferase [Paenibacillus rigui]